MYSEIKYNICTNVLGKKVLLAQPIKALIDLKRGCQLSPTLANIILYDIHVKLRQNDICMGNIYLNSISWADDLVIFSTKHSSTQSLLNTLASYCTNMNIKVNMSKTKALIFSKGRPKRNKSVALLFNKSVISYCTSYKYLGVEFDQNCTFTSARKNRIQKAQNAVFLLHAAFHTSNSPSITLASKLFTAKIFPILLYGAAMWGPTQNLNIPYSSVQHITPKHTHELNLNFSKFTSKPITTKLVGKKDIPY